MSAGMLDLEIALVVRVYSHKVMENGAFVGFI